MKVAAVRRVALLRADGADTAPRRHPERLLRAWSSSWNAGSSLPGGRRGFPCARRSPWCSPGRLRWILCEGVYDQVRRAVSGSAGIPDSLGDKRVSTSGPPFQPTSCSHVPAARLPGSTHLVSAVVAPSLFAVKEKRIHCLPSKPTPAVECPLTCANIRCATARNSFFAPEMHHLNGVWNGIARVWNVELLLMCHQENRKSNPGAARRGRCQ